MLKSAVFDFTAHDNRLQEGEAYINRHLEMLELTREQIVSVNCIMIDPDAGFSGRRYKMVILYDVKKILVGLICALTVASSLTSCGTELGVDSAKYCDFMVVARNFWGVSGESYAVCVDKNTGVCYLQFGKGITALLDADGKPII